MRFELSTDKGSNTMTRTLICKASQAKCKYCFKKVDTGSYYSIFLYCPAFKRAMCKECHIEYKHGYDLLTTKQFRHEDYKIDIVKHEGKQITGVAVAAAYFPSIPLIMQWFGHIKGVTHG